MENETEQPNGRNCGLLNGDFEEFLGILPKPKPIEIAEISE